MIATIIFDRTFSEFYVSDLSVWFGASLTLIRDDEEMMGSGFAQAPRGEAGETDCAVGKLPTLKAWQVLGLLSRSGHMPATLSIMNHPVCLLTRSDGVLSERRFDSGPLLAGTHVAQGLVPIYWAESDRSPNED